MPSYLTHAMEGRARLRHPALAGIAGREKALAVLTGASGVLGFAGKGRAHLLAGTAFGLLAARHVWMRRKALM